jgi:hypothetical protein
MLGRQGLGAKHVQRRARQMAVVDQRDQVAIDQMAAARHIDDVAAGLQARQGVQVHDALRVGRERQQAHQDAAGRQEILEALPARFA